MTKRRRATTALATAVAALLIASGCGQSDEGSLGDEGGDSPALTFVSVPSQQPVNLRRLYQPILEMVGKETDREIRL